MASTTPIPTEPPCPRIPPRRRRRPRRRGPLRRRRPPRTLGLAVGVGGGACSGSTARRTPTATSHPDNELSTPTRALVSENLDLDLVGVGADVGDDALGKLRLDVTSRDGKPVFVGVAHTDDVDAYVRGSAHAVVRDFDFRPFGPRYDDRPAAPLAPPATGDFWVASGDGDARARLEGRATATGPSS